MRARAFAIGAGRANASALRRRDGESEAEFFERIGSHRWTKYITAIEREAVLAAHGYCGSPCTALDVGAGVGRWSQFVTELGWKLVCTDVSAEALAVCQRRMPEAACIRMQETGESLPGEDGQFGLVMCMEVFHVASADWFIAETWRVLAPGGVLVGVFANRRSLRGLLKHATYTWWRSHYFDLYSRSYPEWKTAIERKGFQVLREKGMCWLPFSRASNSPLITPLVELERLLGLQRVTDLSPWIVFVARKPVALPVIRTQTGVGDPAG
jgi:2-polyprenyl-3-methyl-5-hydroxy-6-metoxy-1,4-benzoquinol methylase